MWDRLLQYRLHLGLATLSLAILWYGPLLTNLVRPALIRSGLQTRLAPVLQSFFGYYDDRLGDFVANPFAIDPRDYAPTAYYNDLLGDFVYPGLGISAPVTVAPAINPLSQTDWQAITPQLNRGLSLTYPESTFEASRLAYLIGHSSYYYPYPYAYTFSGLGQARIDDTFDLTLGEKNYRYKVVKTTVLNPNDRAGFAALAPNNSDTQHVVLVTCWPLFTTDNRLAVVGERVN